MKLYVFDVSNIFHRAFWGNEGLATTDGFPTNGLHGFLRIVLSIIRDHKPDLIAFAQEGGSNMRKTISPLYKAHREEPNPDLKVQLDMMPELISAMSFPTFTCSGYEADDVIATLARLARMSGIDTVIVSSDKDFCQIVDEKVSIFNLSNNTMVTPNEVFLKYGISPAQFLDYLSIVGDASDNIKGVQGIGPKGAVELLTTYGSLDNVYRNVDTIKGAKKTKLQASEADAFLARKLASFMVAPIGSVDLQASCKYNGPNKEVLRPFLRRLEFRELEQMILGAAQVVNVGGVDIGVRK